MLAVTGHGALEFTPSRSLRGSLISSKRVGYELLSARPTLPRGGAYECRLARCLLLLTAAVSFFVGDRTDAIIIGVILALSTLLGFANEYRAEIVAEDLHEQLRHKAVVCRDGSWTSCDVTALVPGGVVRLTLGGLVPADLRIISADGLECDESADDHSRNIAP